LENWVNIPRDIIYSTTRQSSKNFSMSHAGLNSDLFNPAEESNLRWWWKLYLF